VAVVVVAPWLIKNQIWVDNPVYPVLEGVFDGANWDGVQSQQLTAWQRSMGMGRGVADYLLLPFNISVRAKPGLNYTRFDGTLSPLFLALLPLVLLRRKRRVTVLIAIAIAGFAFWVLTSQQLRFLIPTIALAAVLAAIGISHLLERMPGRRHALFLGLVLVATASLLVTPDQYGRPLLANTFGDRLGPVLGLETRRAHLERTVQSFAMFEHINANLPPGEPVLMIWENRAYYLNRPYLADSFFEASTLMRMAARAGDAARLGERISEMGYRYVVVNEMLGDFFSRRYPPRETAILKSLVKDHLEPLHSSNGLTLYRLRRD